MLDEPERRSQTPQKLRLPHSEQGSNERRRRNESARENVIGDDFRREARTVGGFLSCEGDECGRSPAIVETEVLGSVTTGGGSSLRSVTARRNDCYRRSVALRSSVRFLSACLTAELFDAWSRYRVGLTFSCLS